MPEKTSESHRRSQSSAMRFPHNKPDHTPTNRLNKQRRKYDVEFTSKGIKCPPEKASAWRRVMLELLQAAMMEETLPEETVASKLQQSKDKEKESRAISQF